MLHTIILFYFFYFVFKTFQVFLPHPVCLQCHRQCAKVADHTEQPVRVTHQSQRLAQHTHAVIMAVYGKSSSVTSLTLELA